MYVELLGCAQKYICIEKGATDWRQSEGKGQKKIKKDGTLAGPSKVWIDKEAPSRQQSPNPKNFGYRYDSYTPLTIPRA